MRQQYNENECWGLGKEEGLMSKVEGVKFFCEFLLFCYFAEFLKSILFVINFNDSFNNLVFLGLCETYRFSS